MLLYRKSVIRSIALQLFLTGSLLRVLLPVAITVVVLSGCSQAHTQSGDNTSRVYDTQFTEVNAIVLENAPFQKEIVSNGKLKALRKSELKFKVGGELRQLYVRNGNTVKVGQTIGVLDQFEYRQQVEQAETSLKKAAIDFEDALLSHGGFRMKRDSIPPAIFEGAAIRSGYIAAERDLKTARFNLEGTVLKAPFTGKVASIKSNVYEQVSPEEVFCTIIDDGELEVEFYLLESEVREVTLNNRVKIIPFAVSGAYYGYVSEINPLVEENGLVLAKAYVKNDGTLWEGMNARVIIEKEVLHQLVVPKSSIVTRQNQAVLFKFVQGKAFWTYIQTGLENSTSCTVIADPDKEGTLQPGDTVIISDNLNLGHESEVTIRKIEHLQDNR
jgi:membrane fusion protein, multidrug efflux system